MDDKTHLWRGIGDHKSSEKGKGTIEQTSSDVHFQVGIVGGQFLSWVIDERLVTLTPLSEPEVAKGVGNHPQNLHQEN